MVLAEVAVAHGQGWRQVGELLLAFALSSVIGIERQFRGKSAGLRTQSIVGTTSALILIVSKYGFGDVLSNHVVLDPSRVAAQIVSGIGFLGAGLIITRRGAIRGLTTAAAVWETAAIGMAAGAGLPLLALVVTALHFVIVLLYTPLGRYISAHGHGESRFAMSYADGRGVLRSVMQLCSARGWSVHSLAMVETGRGGDEPDPGTAERLVAVELTVTGRGASDAATQLLAIDGVVAVYAHSDDDE